MLHRQLQVLLERREPPPQLLVRQVQLVLLELQVLLALLVPLEQQVPQVLHAIQFLQQLLHLLLMAMHGLTLLLVKLLFITLMLIAHNGLKLETMLLDLRVLQVPREQLVQLAQLLALLVLQVLHLL